MGNADHSIFGFLRSLGAQEEAQGYDDRVLIERYVSTGDELAFESLVRRHAPMVLRVCHQITQQHQDAEDVFQATFLILARKAFTIRNRQSIASWLYTISNRLAFRVRARTAAQQPRECVRELSSCDRQVKDISVCEIQAVIHEEIGQMTDAYRAPLVLCYLEGRTQKDAARRLGWSVAMVRRRLDAGRTLLRARLTRRGLGVGMVLLAPDDVFAKSAFAGKLITCTMEAARALMVGPLKVHVNSQVMALVRNGLTSMLLAKLTNTGLIITGGAMVITAAALLWLAPSMIKNATNHAGGESHRAATIAQRARRTDLQGDPLPPKALVRLGTVRFRTGSEARAVALSPRGQMLATVSDDGTLRLWDTRTGRETRELRVEGGFGRCLAFTRNGSFLVTGGGRDDSTIRIWDSQTTKELRVLNNAGDWIEHMAVAPNGKTVAGSSPSQRVLLWDFDTGTFLGRLQGPGESTFAGPITFSCDGRYIAQGAASGKVIVWDISSKEQLVLKPKDQKTSNPNANRVLTIAFAPNGRTLVSCSTDGAIRLWDLERGVEALTIPKARATVVSLAFSPDGATLACGDNLGRVRILNAMNGKELGKFQAHERRACGLAFSRDSQSLFTCGDTVVRLWRLPKGEEILFGEGHTASITNCFLLPDQSTLATVSVDKTVRQWNLATGQPLSQKTRSRNPALRGMDISYDGKLTAIIEGDKIGKTAFRSRLRLCEFNGGKEIAVASPSNIQSALMSSDGKSVLTRAWDTNKDAGYICLWDAPALKESRILAKHQDGFDEFVIGPKGKTVAALVPMDPGPLRGVGTSILVYDTKMGKLLTEIPLPDDFHYSFSFSPDGSLLAIADGVRISDPDSRVLSHYVHLWSVLTGKELLRFGQSLYAHMCPRFSPDGRSLVTASKNYTIHGWEVLTGGRRFQLDGHKGEITKLLYLDQGNKLVSSSSDATVLIWETTDGVASQSDTTNDTQALWEMLAQGKSQAAYTALCAMVRAPTPTLSFLRQHLTPAKAVDEAVIQQLILDLDSPSFSKRHEASRRLASLDLAAETALRRALATDVSRETHQRIQGLLHRLESISPRLLQSIRAVEVLERIATPGAEALLEALAIGSMQSRLTHEARASLTRIRSRSP